MRLFCLPFAGGSPTLFRGWPEAFPDDIEVIGLRLPGRDMRIGEPACTRWPELVERLEDALADLLDLPFAIFGYSMGSMVAYELTRRLMHSGAAMPNQLILAACRAPHVPALAPSMADAPTPILIDGLRAIGGMPDGQLPDTASLSLFEPMIRADLGLAEHWPHGDHHPLPVRVVTIAGSDDRVAPQSSVDAWRIHATAGYRGYVLTGGHFFIRDRVDELLEIVRSALKADLSLAV